LAVSQAGLILPRAWGADAEFVTVDTAYGKLRGTTDRDVKVFKGIHYGGSTGGKNRFKPPVKPEKWTGVRDALEWGATVPQNKYSQEKRGYVLWTSQPGEPPMNEDCLVLNVFTPATTGKRPVMMWLHGGGFNGGSASSDGYSGVNLARLHDVVVVSINHRLNLMGQTYLAHHLGSEYDGSGAAGILDIVAALEWTRDNIGQFGGDPKNVTIFGQSGGGQKVAVLMGMPSAKGLFHRAIIQSGATENLTRKEDGIDRADALLRELNLSPKQASQLMDLPLEQLMAAELRLEDKIQVKQLDMLNAPVVDGKFIPTDYWYRGAPKLTADVPLLLGWDRTEAEDALKPTPENMAMTQAGLRDRLKQELLNVDPNLVIAAFNESFPGSTPWETFVLVMSQFPRGAVHQDMARRRVEIGAKQTYLFRFDFVTPEGGGHLHTPHGTELPFVFHNLDRSGQLIRKMPEAQALEDQVSTTWTTFARTGNPNNPKLPNWPAYSVDTRDVMLFNTKSGSQSDPQKAARMMMEEVMNLV
jgi:para-nitrobenzyl esterase